MINWRQILSYRTNTEWIPGARVEIDLTERKREALIYGYGPWTRNEYPEGSMGTIVSKLDESRSLAWVVEMDNGILEVSGYPSFYQRDLKLI